jgi:hypothetical protein
VDVAPGRIRSEFRALLSGGAWLLPAGAARRSPRRLLSRYPPSHRVDLFDTRYYLSSLRQNPDIRFFVAYVVQTPAGARRARVWPRIFYKDVSLVWRSASHYVRSERDNWIGKGEVRDFVVAGEAIEAAVEATTDLPVEVQTALEALCRRARRVPTDHDAVAWVLRRGPDGRLDPYADFTGPRRRARADRRNLVHGGRPIARFTRRDDPTSLVFAAGYAPDFARGVLERSASTSTLYHGRVRRFRVLSRNREIQYLFFAGPRQVWLAPPQATTTELSSYGVRTIDVEAPEELSIPGYEYHYVDEAEDPPRLVSQIPAGFVGAQSDVDDARADASPWLERLPVVREFRRKLLSPSAARGSARR